MVDDMGHGLAPSGELCGERGTRQAEAWAIRVAVSQRGEQVSDVGKCRACSGSLKSGALRKLELSEQMGPQGWETQLQKEKQKYHGKCQSNLPAPKTSSFLGGFRSMLSPALSSALSTAQGTGGNGQGRAERF